jgi:glutathione S-transferase
MADLIFYTNPQSRGQTVRWMLEEVGEPYETEVLDYASTMKTEPYLSVNPMGKVPAIKHRGKVVTERPRRLLSLDLLHVGSGRGRVQQQGRRLGAHSGAATHVRLRQLRSRHQYT